MIVYHGSGLAIETPDLVHSRKAVDFGAGFYTTPILKQAVNWCEKRRRRWERAVVSRYEFDENAAANLKVVRIPTFRELVEIEPKSSREGCEFMDGKTVCTNPENITVFGCETEEADDEEDGWRDYELAACSPTILL